MASEKRHPEYLMPWIWHLENVQNYDSSTASVIQNVVDTTNNYFVLENAASETDIEHLKSRTVNSDFSNTQLAILHSSREFEITCEHGNHVADMS